MKRVLLFIFISPLVLGMEQPLQSQSATGLSQELQRQIMLLVSATRSAEKAVENLRNLPQANDPQVTTFIIEQLAQRFAPDNDKLYAAFILGTDQAINWVISHYGTSDEEIKSLINMAIQTEMNKVAFKLIDRFPLLAQEEFEYQDPWHPLGRKQVSTFMIEAIAKENIPLIRKLLSIGFDPNKKRDGETPYFLWIMDKNNLEMVQIYLDAGANPDLADENGITPLMKAAQRGDVKAVELLLTYGANKNLIDKWRYNALSRVQDEKEITEHLLQRIPNSDTARKMLDSYNKVILLLQENKRKIALRKNYSKRHKYKIA